MGKLFKKYFWTILVVIASLGLAGSAAYFSISGLSKLFAGSALQIIVMASFIEFSKLVTTAALHRYWKGIGWILKSVLTFMVVIIMMITSMGIYGFLADAYSSTSTKLDKVEGEIALIEKQKLQKDGQIKNLESIKMSKSERISSLSNLRGQQESRIDALYQSNRGVKGAQTMIEQSNRDIQSLQIEVDTLVAKIGRANSEIAIMDANILELQSSDVATEIGPLKYMSTVLNRPMESIINWFILAIIGVFDPLAVLLVILASTLYDKAKKEEIEKVELEDEFEENPKKEEVIQTIKDQADLWNNNLNSDSKIEFEDGDEDFEHIEDLDDNNTSQNSSHEEKGDRVAEYVEGENGNFERAEPLKEDITSLINGIDSNPLYLQLIDILFLNGERGVGDTVPPYKSLIKDIRDKDIDCSDKVIKSFLTICNLFDITNMSDKDNVKIMKDYKTSRDIISLVSK